MRYAHVPVKQAVISPSALSLMYPAENLPGYTREEFINDLLGEHEKEIRGCFAKGAHMVQIDFTEGRLAVKIDPSGALLKSFIELNNLALSRFSEEERRQIGVHTCQGCDPQRGGGLRSASAEPVRTPGGEIIYRACWGTGSHARAADDPTIPRARTPDLHRSRFADRSSSRTS
jgi:hypothetical protein